VSEKDGVPAPNVDTLYSSAWLDLSSQPIVLHVPPATRFSVVALLSPYTEDFANIGNGAAGLLAPGDYVIAGPTQLVGDEEAEGLKVIHSPYSRVWVIARTLVASSGELPGALALQEATRLVPLNRWGPEGLGYEPPPPSELITTPRVYVIPGAHGVHPLNYWAALGSALERFAPPPADRPLLEQLAAVHIGPGLSPTSANSGEGTLVGLSEAVSAGPSQVVRDLRAQLQAHFAAHNGWFVAGLGDYATNYQLRVIADRYGIGAPTPNVTTYMAAVTDRAGGQLNGAAARYVAHFPASDFPVPVQGFWSITLYSASGRLVDNPIDRFSLGGGSNLQFNLDGSLDVYLQSSEPGSEAQRENWLPAPSGGFQLVLRLYGANEMALPGILAGGAGHWRPPTVELCLASGRTIAGWPCAQ
jgi:hypothetical protein